MSKRVKCPRTGPVIENISRDIVVDLTKSTSVANDDDISRFLGALGVVFMRCNDWFINNAPSTNVVLAKGILKDFKVLLGRLRFGTHKEHQKEKVRKVFTKYMRKTYNGSYKFPSRWYPNILKPLHTQIRSLNLNMGLRPLEDMSESFEQMSFEDVEHETETSIPSPPAYSGNTKLKCSCNCEPY